MIVYLSEEGRITIPKPMRIAIGIQPGDALILGQNGNHQLTITPEDNKKAEIIKVLDTLSPTQISAVAESLGL